MTYGKRTLIAVNQLINTLFMDWPDRALCSRCYRWAPRTGVRNPTSSWTGCSSSRGTLQGAVTKREGGRQSPPGCGSIMVSRFVVTNRCNLMLTRMDTELVSGHEALLESNHPV